MISTTRRGAIDVGRATPQTDGREPSGTGLTLDHLAERAGWSAACAALLILGALGGAPVDIAIVAVALWGGYRCWASPGGPSRRLQGVLLGTIAMAVAVSLVGHGASYAGDEMAFGQYSATLVLQGLNPFTHSLAPSLQLYHVPPLGVTHYLSGSKFASPSYPAGSFLFYLPALALGLHAQASVVTDTIFWVTSMILMWALLPRSVNWLAALFLASSVYIGYAVGGVTDVLYLPFVILAMWRWDRYGDAAERSVARWTGPVALGVAMSVKQTPWFLLPFLLVGVAFEAHEHGFAWFRRSARYLVICAAVFAAINAPWIVASPRAWFEGSLAPLTASFVPMGSGLINLTLRGRIGGGDLMLYTLAGAAWLGMSLLLMTLRYQKTKRAWAFLVIASFFFVARSMGNYLLMLIPGAIIAALSVGEATGDGPLVTGHLVRKLSRGALLMSMLAVIAGVVGAAAAPAPLDMTVVGLSTTGQQGLVTSATMRIHNNTARRLHPTFTVFESGFVTNFWTPAGRAGHPVTIGPHQTETLSLQAPDVASMPHVSAPFQMLGYTTGPAAASSSQVYTASTVSTYLTPEAIDSPVGVGKSFVFATQLVDVRGGALHRAGVRVDLGQVIYAQNGVLRGVASIDGQPEGASPATATTNADGIATFTVRGLQADSNPDYFQSWVAPSGRQFPPTGYSKLVAVRFSP